MRRARGLLRRGRKGGLLVRLESRLLLLLLLKLLLKLRRDRRHRGSAGLEALLLLRLLLLSRKAGKLLLERLSRLQSLALHWKASELLLQRSLSEARRLGRKGARLLTGLLLLACAQVSERPSTILLLPGSLAISA